jgi:hypothetical protein
MIDFKIHKTNHREDSIEVDLFLYMARELALIRGTDS